jgi:hypothetical protein
MGHGNLAISFAAYRFMAALVFVTFFGAEAALGKEYAAGPETYVSVVATLQPGDILTLSPGDYRYGLSLHGLHGAPNNPIVVQGTGDGNAAILLARAGANTISLANASYVTVRNIRIDGAHLPVDGVKAEGTSGPVHHITLENLTIVNHDYAQDIIAISSKCPAWGWVLRDNVIIGAGTGMYLGSSDGTAPFFDGLIENNLIVDTIGYNIEIKHQIERPELPGAPTTPSVTIVRRNIFAKTRKASVGGAARPNLLVGHFPLHGNGQADRYEIVDNIFFDNPTEALFQGEGNLTLARNLLFNPDGSAVVVQPHHDRPRRVSVAENFIAAEQRGIVMRGGDSGMVQDIVRNDIYARYPLQGGLQRDNRVGTFAEAAAALRRWLPRPGEPKLDQAMDRLRLTWFARRTCKLTGDATAVDRTPSPMTPRRHPLCDFLRTLSSVSQETRPDRR